MVELNSKEEKKQFYRMVCTLVLPMALQNLINVGVQSADVIMLGKVGETALSGYVYHVPDLLWPDVRGSRFDSPVLGKERH